MSDGETGPAQTNEASANTSPATSAATKGGVAFREGDVQVFLDMAKAEEAQGNITGAETLRSMANKLETIMSNKPSNPAAGGIKAEEKKEEKQESAEPVMWPYVHPSLSAAGKQLKKTGTDARPTAARMRDPYTPGEDIVTWKLKVDQRQGPMTIGLTSLMVDLDSDWSDPDNANKAFFITQSGTMFNGDQVVVETGKALETGDEVGVKLDGDALFFSINGEELAGSIRPVAGSLRMSVGIKGAGDAVSFVSEEAAAFVPDDASNYGTATLSRTTIDDEDDTALLSGLLPKQAKKAREGVEQKKTSPWKMEVDQESGGVYYWHTETKETTWDRPADFLGGSETAFLEEEGKAGKLLQKTEEDKKDVMWNNADAGLDSHKAVQFDADGFPSVDKFVYVDEITCIGCTNCATVARSTFYMNSDHGRARAFRQGGDSDDVIEEAVSTCPVDCIWYVSWDDLVVLEQERKAQVINPYARLMGGSFIESHQPVSGQSGGGGPSKASIMNSGKMRCNNCPGRGCKECPLYGVGENPEFLRKKASRDRRRKMKKEARMDGGAGRGLKLSDDGLYNEEGVLDSINTWSDSDSFTDSSDLTPTMSEMTEDDKAV